MARMPPKIPHPYPHAAYEPLNTTWFVASIVGFLISIIVVSQYSIPWAAAFGLVFALMFIASMFAMRRAMPDEQLLIRPRRIR